MFLRNVYSNSPFGEFESYLLGHNVDFCTAIDLAIKLVWVHRHALDMRLW